MKKKNQNHKSLIDKQYKYELLENGFSNEDISIGKKENKIIVIIFNNRFSLIS